MIELNTIPVLNKQTIDTIIHQANGDNVIIHEIFESFVYDVQNMIDQIQVAIAKSDFIQFKIVIHTIKGLSATIGASQLHVVSKEIDSLLKAGKNEDAITFIPLLAEIYNTCKILVKDEFKIV